MRGELRRKVPVSEDRSGTLLVRVWLEGGGTEHFRARVSAVASDAPDEDRTVAVASSPREVLDAVRDWLDDFTGSRSTTD